MKAAFLSLAVALALVAHLAAMAAADLASLPLVTLNSSYALKTLSGFDLSQAAWGPSLEGLSLAVFPAPMVDTTKGKESIVVLIKNESKDEEQILLMNYLPTLDLTDRASGKRVWWPSPFVNDFAFFKVPPESMMAFQIPFSYSTVKGMTLEGELGVRRPDHSSVSLKSEPFSVGS